MKDLRLLLLKECDRSCRGCCNKDWDLGNLPVVSDFRGYSKIMLTGGEPLLDPNLVVATVERIRSQTNAPVILYTAMTKDQESFLRILELVDGVTLTLHSRKDVEPFNELQRVIRDKIQGKSMRLNCFSTIPMPKVDTSGWNVKSNIRWIKDCPLPENEVFARI